MTGFRMPAWYRVLGFAARLAGRLVSSSRIGPWPSGDSKPVWIHAASLGELKGSIRLARNLPHPTEVLLTSTTLSGLRKLQQELPDCRSCLLPLDENAAIRDFLLAVSPRCAVFLESEAWPCLLQNLSHRRIPIAFAGFRTSSASLARWHRFGWLFAGWTRTIATVWVDDSRSLQAVRNLGFEDVRAGTSLKWAGAASVAPDPNADLAAAVSIHLRDLPELARLARSNHRQGWLWFPRRRLWSKPLAWLARSLGFEVVDHPSPGPGEVWIAKQFGEVQRLLPRCRFAWVSPGHDTQEPHRLGVVEVLTGSPASQAPFSAGDADLTMVEILDWISRR